MGIKDGKVIAEYESMREAERQTNIAHSCNNRETEKCRWFPMGI